MSSFKAVRNSAAADIIFLVDSSWNMGKEHFQLVRQFLYDGVWALAGGEQDFHFALVQFNGDPKTEFLLNTYRTSQEVLSHISNLTYTEASDRSEKGLEYVMQTHLSREAGSRAGDGVPQLIMVLSHGPSAGPSPALPTAGLTSVAAAANVFAARAEEPLRMHVSNLENFTSLPNLVGSLVSWVQSSVASGEAPKDLTGNASLAMLPACLLACLCCGAELGYCKHSAATPGSGWRWVREEMVVTGLKTKVWFFSAVF